MPARLVLPQGGKEVVAIATHWLEPMSVEIYVIAGPLLGSGTIWAALFVPFYPCSCTN